MPTAALAPEMLADAAVRPARAADVADTRGDALPPGTRLNEFELQRVLGIGGFGIVYLALDHALLRQVAIKEYMPGELARRGGGAQVSMRSAGHAETFNSGLQSFLKEAQLLARFDHPALVKVHRYWEANGTAYMAMQYVAGRTLNELQRVDPARPDEAALRRWVEPLLGALEALHEQGVFHRDISPDNILMQPDGCPVLLDFGAARRVIGDRTQALTAVLKPSFAPIEQYGDMPGLRQGPWTDLYALGAVVHYLLTGRHPVPAVVRAVHDSMPALSVPEPAVAGFSPSFLAAIDWTLGVRPQERPQHVQALREALAGTRVPPPPAPRLPEVAADEAGVVQDSGAEAGTAARGTDDAAGAAACGAGDVTAGRIADWQPTVRHERERTLSPTQAAATEVAAATATAPTTETATQAVTAASLRAAAKAATVRMAEPATAPSVEAATAPAAKPSTAVAASPGARRTIAALAVVGVVALALWVFGMHRESDGSVRDQTSAHQGAVAATSALPANPSAATAEGNRDLSAERRTLAPGDTADAARAGAAAIGAPATPPAATHPVAPLQPAMAQALATPAATQTETHASHPSGKTAATGAAKPRPGAHRQANDSAAAKPARQDGALAKAGANGAPATRPTADDAPAAGPGTPSTVAHTANLPGKPKAAPADPREACAGRNFLAMSICLNQRCLEPAFQQHAQCLELKAYDERRRQAQMNR